MPAQLPLETSFLRIYMAPGTFALKLGEVMDDGHILKCATKNQQEPFQNGSISLDYTTQVYGNKSI